MTLCQNRNSKLESYLKRTLPQHVFEDIRYYERCIVKEPKGSLTLKYVILTGKAVLLATHPFKTVSEAVKLVNILSVGVEHDYPEFLKGKDGHNCVHIRVNYESRGPESAVGDLKDVTEEEAETEDGERDDDVASKKDDSSDSNGTDDFKRCDVSRRLSVETEINSSGADLHITSSKEVKKLHSSRRKIVLDRTKSEVKVSVSLPLREMEHTVNSDPQNRSSPQPENSSGQSGEDSSLTDARVDEEVARATSRPQEPHARSMSSLLRRVRYEQPRPSRSYSSMDHHPPPRSPLINTPGERRSQSVLDKPRVPPNAKDVEVGAVNVLKKPSEDIHIYVLQRRPRLLNHLLSSWANNLFNRTLQISKDFRADVTSTGQCDTSRLENVYYQFSKEITSPDISHDTLYKLLEELLVGFYRRPQLKVIFWKDQMLYHFLIQQLEYYMFNSNHVPGELEADIVIQHQRARLELSVSLLKTVSAVFQETDNVQEKFKMLEFHNGELLQQIVITITSLPYIHVMFQNSCSRMLEDFNEFSTHAWENLPEGELINLMGLITNEVTTILCELMVTITKLGERIPGISIENLFQNVSLENYLKRHVTQLLSLLYPSPSRNLKPEESILVYRHFFVLKCLIDNVRGIHSYMRERYQEEFRYYIVWSRINSKVPERYPVKRVLQPLVEYVHKLGTC